MNLLLKIREIQKQQLAAANRGILFANKKETMSDLAKSRAIIYKLKVA